MHVNPPLVGGPEPDPKPARPNPSRLVAIVVVGVAGGLLGFLVGVTASNGWNSTSTFPVAVSGSTTTGLAPPASSSRQSTTTSGPPATSNVVTSVADSPTTAVEVDLLEGAAALMGDVAVTRHPGSSGGGTLWVFRAGGSVVQRDDVPFWPGDYPHPMLFTAGQIAFADLNHAYLVGADLREPPVAVSPASFVVPGSEPGQVWLAGQGADWVALLDVATGTVGEQRDVADVFWWPLGGMGEGLFVAPVDDATYGSTAYWSPTEGLRPIAGLSGNQAGIHAVAGDLAVVVSPGVMRMLDLDGGEYIASVPLELAEGLVSEVCLSPDQNYVAVFGSTGQAFVADTRTGEVLQRLGTVNGHNSVGWTSNEQVVYIVDDVDARIQALDVATGATHDIAALGSSRGWWLTASGTMC